MIRQAAIIFLAIAAMAVGLAFMIGVTGCSSLRNGYQPPGAGVWQALQ